MKNNTQDLSKDNNINSGDKKQLNCNDKSAKRKEFDVFISYRHLDTKDPKKNPDHKHTTSLAWSIYQALKSKGFNVFFDCAYNLEDTIPTIDKCRYFIILITQDSIDAIKTYSFEKIKTMLENNERGDGFNYVRELYEIENRINQEPIDEKETIAIDKKNVFLLNIDDRRTYTDISDIPTDISGILKGQHYNKLGEIIWTPFETDQRFKASIDGLIKPNNGSGNRIRKKVQFFNKELPWLRFSFKSCKALSWIGLAFLILSMFLGYRLYQYLGTPIIFAGGGTVRQYINSIYHIDVNHYKRNAQYIHLPSTTAWQLLWDDVNEDDPRKLCPIVLSATEIDTNNANTSELRSKGKRIAAYLVGSTPLKVQVFNHHVSEMETKPITPERLRKLLEEENTTIWTTTKESGTYLEYKKLLDSIGGFDLDDIVNQQKDGRHDFDLVKYIDFSNNTQQHIFLANDNYYYQQDNPDDSFDSFSIVKYNSDTATIPLYVYTIATENKNKGKVELLPQAKEFLKKIECDTEKSKGIKDSIIATWPKRKEK